MGRWLKYGCFGCLALVTIVVGVAILFVGLPLLRVQGDETAERVVAPTVPEVVPPPAEATTPVPAPTGATAGRVIVELADAEFYVEPARPGEKLRVEASYDKRLFELRESFEPGAGEVGWTYRVSFERTGSWLVATVKNLMGSQAPKLRLFLPPEVPLALELEVSRGGAKVDLGGLWLTSADVAVNMGGLEFEVGRPLHAPMERLSLSASMGGVAARGLGDASPRRLEIECNMGGLAADLGGHWQNDSDVSIRVRRGGASIGLPRDVRVEGVEGRGLGTAAPSEIPAPTLRFTLDKDARSDIKFE